MMSLTAIGMTALIWAGLSFHAYHAAQQNLREEARTLANHIEKTLHTLQDQWGEELIAFGNNGSKTQHTPDKSYILHSKTAHPLTYHWSLVYEKPELYQYTGLWSIAVSMTMIEAITRKPLGKVTKYIPLYDLHHMVAKQ